MRRTVVALGACWLAGCASRTGAPPDLSQQRIGSQSIVAGSGSASVALRSEATATSAIVDLTPDKAFAALEAAYIALGIPIAEKAPASRRLGNPAFRVRRKLGDLPLIKLLDCGSDSGMPNAETYILTLTITSVVSPNAAGGVGTADRARGRREEPVDERREQRSLRIPGGAGEAHCGARESIGGEVVARGFRPPGVS